MNVTAHAIVAAAIFALAGAAGTQPAAAQSATPSPMAPRLIAPHNVAFVANTTDGLPPGVTHDAWVGGHGTWASSTEDGMLQTHATFTGLVPNGHYSLFTRHTENKTLVIQPIDHSGATNSFVASATGSATLTVTVSQQAMPGDEIMLVYHTDSADHPKTIGKLGTDAFVQMRLVQP